MKNLKKVLSVVAVAAALATPLAADAWWGPWNNNNNGWGNNNNNWGNNFSNTGMADIMSWFPGLISLLRPSQITLVT